jgi:hypothetical protein
MRALVLSFENIASIRDGAILYTCRVHIDAGVGSGSYILRNSEQAASGPSQESIPAIGRDGTVTVLADALVGIDIGTVHTGSGQHTSVAVQLDALTPSAPPVVGTQNDIAFDPTTPIAAAGDGTPDCTVNPAIHKDATGFLFLPPGCVAGVSCTGVRAFVLAIDNTTPILDGSVLYRCAVQVGTSVAPGVYPLRNSNALASGPLGQAVVARGGDGFVQVGCAGDCDGNGQVTIFDLIRGINILLGTESLSACPAFDTDGSGTVTVNEIIQAVATALRGCT